MDRATVVCIQRSYEELERTPYEEWIAVRREAQHKIVKGVVDCSLLCPSARKSAERYYKPEPGTAVEDGFPCCANCGCLKATHKKLEE